MRQAASHPTVVSRDSVKHSDLCDALKSIFAQSVPPIRACYDFLNRKQASCDSANDYLLALRSLLPDCDFPSAEQDRMMCIAFTIGCRNKATQEKLLSQPKIDLEEYIRIAKADESARENAAAIRGETAVNKLQRPFPKQQPYTKSENSNVPEKPQSCSGCGSRTHRSKDKSCPARDVTCHFCHFKGHFQKHCMKRQRQQQGNRTKSVSIVEI